ncbi:MAG TPA: hypothetical protein VFN61_16610 [Acidimicrobiales bacterium]|nr:hypothetical protein [Acidimicrobiales bacterium]
MHTWGETVDQALTRLKEAAAMWFDSDEGSITLIPRPVLAKGADRTAEDARQAQEQARTARNGRQYEQGSTDGPNAPLTTAFADSVAFFRKYRACLEVLPGIVDYVNETLLPGNRSNACRRSHQAASSQGGP